MRVMFAMGFLILGGLFVVGLTNPERESWVLDQLVAFAPARLDNEDFELDLDRGIKDAMKANKPLFIDFTGVNCVNCRLMEKRMAKLHNSKRLKRCVLVQLYTDKVPKVAADEAKRILEKNIALQKGWFGDVTLPAYVVATPDGKTILSTYLGLEKPHRVNSQNFWTKVGINGRRCREAKSPKWIMNRLVETIADSRTSESPAIRDVRWKQQSWQTPLIRP